MRILVTGHLGYIGTVTVPLLLEHGHEVAGCDTDLFRGSTFGRAIGPAASVPNLSLDIRDLRPDHLAGVDAVVHLAGLSNHPLGNRDPMMTDAINHHAAVHVAEMKHPRRARANLSMSHAARLEAVLKAHLGIKKTHKGL